MIEVNENGQVRVKFGYYDVSVGCGVKPEDNLYVLCFEQLDEPNEQGYMEYVESLDMEAQKVIIDFVDSDIETLDQLIDDLNMIRFFKKKQLKKSNEEVEDKCF